jgi:hypothetical protein
LDDDPYLPVELALKITWENEEGARGVGASLVPEFTPGKVSLA